MILSDTVKDIQSKVRDLEGIQAAPDEPTESIGIFPFSVCYARSGSCSLISSGWGNYLHTIICEIHVSRSLLPQAIREAMTYIELFVQAIIADPQLSSTVQTVNDIRYTFGALRWAEEEHIGIRFEIDVKLSITG